MYRRIAVILKESLQWISLRIKYKIDYSKVVLALTGEDKKIDYYALAYLEKYMKRKFAKSAVILYNDRVIENMLKDFQFSFPTETVCYPPLRMKALYDYYSFDKFFDNIVFTYKTFPKYNLLGKVLNETSINEQDAVCLALYHLREVPEIKKMEKSYVW